MSRSLTPGAVSKTAPSFRPQSDRTACFSVIADAEPGVMPRVLELFIKRSLIPTYWCSRVSGDELAIDVQMRGLDDAVALSIAACFRQLPSVRTVLTSERYPA